MGTGGVACPKPVKSKTLKGRKRRTEAAVKREVREIVAERDLSCRMEGMAPGKCRGWLQWAHLRPRSRWQTRGMDPEYRHTTTYTAMFCEEHHGMYDAHVFDLHYINDLGADGPLDVIRR